LDFGFWILGFGFLNLSWFDPAREKYRSGINSNPKSKTQNPKLH